MARILSQTLFWNPQTLTLTKNSCFQSFFSARRAKSGGPDSAQLIEIDLGPDPESGSGPEGSEVELEMQTGMKRLEDAIHGIIVRRSRPDWLPFVPGSSYWVPPKGKRALGVIELMGKIGKPLSEDETLSLTSFRGWPSSAYFLDEALPHPVKRSSRKIAVQSDDEE